MDVVRIGDGLDWLAHLEDELRGSKMDNQTLALNIKQELVLDEIHVETDQDIVGEYVAIEQYRKLQSPKSKQLERALHRSWRINTWQEWLMVREEVQRTSDLQSCLEIYQYDLEHQPLNDGSLEKDYIKRINAVLQHRSREVK